MEEKKENATNNECEKTEFNENMGFHTLSQETK